VGRPSLPGLPRGAALAGMGQLAAAPRGLAGMQESPSPTTGEPAFGQPRNEPGSARPWAHALSFKGDADALLGPDALGRSLQGGGAAWKEGYFAAAPGWVRAVMAGGLRSPAGALAVAGLMGCPLWAWACRSVGRACRRLSCRVLMCSSAAGALCCKLQQMHTECAAARRVDPCALLLQGPPRQPVRQLVGGRGGSAGAAAGGCR
jgi:hypothetical protein